MTDEEILALAREVLAGKSRSYVDASKIFAEYIQRTSHRCERCEQLTAQLSTAHKKLEELTAQLLKVVVIS